VAVALALLFLMSCGGARKGAWPDVQISDRQGDAVSSGSILSRGGPAIVTVWSTTCAPCQVELPRLEALRAAEPGLTVAAVNLGDDPERIDAFTARYGIDLPIYIDDAGRLAEALGVAAVPATVFVAASGEVVERRLGALSAEDLAREADRLLARPATSHEG
jgi:thiol-disulfide isomerase/thioredoxin